MPRVADLVDAMRHTWTDLVPKYRSCGSRGTIFFNCIHSLLSFQMQGLIKRSLNDLYKVIVQYKVIYISSHLWTLKCN